MPGPSTRFGNTCFVLDVVRFFRLLHLARRVGQVVCAYRLLLGFYQKPWHGRRSTP
jgi:hypothetical protein